MPEALGRLPATDYRHVEKYPLKLDAPSAPVERILRLNYAYRPRYDQGQEGACVGFSSSWAMSILNRRFYDAFWLWDRAKEIDEWPETNPGDSQGTSIRAAMDTLRTTGHLLKHANHAHVPESRWGIMRNEWCRTVDDVRACIANGVPVVLGLDWMTNFDAPVRKGAEYWIGEGSLGPRRGGHAICCYAASDKRQAVKLVNSWSNRYPLVWLPYAELDRQLNNDPDATIISDRVEMSIEPEGQPL